MSCNTESWANGSLEDAIMMLAKRAAVARVLREKKADMGDTFSNGLSALQRQVELNPALAATLGGAALGAGAGGLSSLAAEPGRRHTGRSMFTGALAGGAVGGGGYMASRMLPQIEQSMQSKGDTSFNGPGGPRQVDSSAIQKNPQVIAEIEKLRSKSYPTQAVNSSWDFAKNYAYNHPFLATLMGADAASHAVGTIGGQMSNLPGGRANVLREGVSRVAGEGGEAGKDVGNKLKGWLTGSSDNDISALLRQARHQGAGGKVNIPGLDGDVSVSTLNDWYNKGTAGGTGLRAGGLQSIQDIFDSFLGGGDHSANPGSVKTRGKFTGLTDAGNARPGRLNHLARMLEGGGEATSMLGKLGPRAALYAGIPALQAYAGTVSQESQNQQRLQQIIEQLSKPAPGA